jgi:small-conductance mechanosensitive channel
MEELKNLLTYPLIKTSDYILNFSDLLFAVVVLIATWFILRLIKRIFKRLVSRGRLGKGVAHSFFQIIKYLVWVVVIITLLDSLGVKVSILLASAAALLVGVGLGLQQFFNDVSSGFIILIEGSIQVDDVVELDGGMIGRVVVIGIRTSKLKTRDNIVTIVPNSKLVNDRVINWTHIEDKTRFHVDVGVAYGSDVERVTRVLLQCADAHDSILIEPRPFVRFNDFGNSSLDFQLFFWTNRSFEVENTKSDLRYKIDAAFRKHAIQIPFPQHDVYIKTMPAKE